MIELDAEVLVIGGGMAGCAAAFEAARRRSTLLVSAGGSATSLGSGCVDFHCADRSAAKGFLDAIDRHLSLVNGGRVVTSVGLDRPTDIHQRGMLTLEEARAAGGIDVLHLPWMRSSHPLLAAHGLRARGVAADIVRVDERSRTVLRGGGDAEAMGKALAKAMPASKKAVVAMPSLWGGLDVDIMLRAASAEGGCEFRELVGPAGPQGLRLQRAAEAASGAQHFLSGCELRGLEFVADRCTAALVRSGLREMRIACAGIIIATGGPLISRPEVDLSLETELVHIASLGAAAPYLRNRGGMAQRAGRTLRNVVVCGSALAELGYLEGMGAGDCLLSGLAASRSLEEGL